MDAARPRPRTGFPEHVANGQALSLSLSKGELVRFFAWGYLSRRELNQRLRKLEPSQRERRPAA
jgi:hypothetical protein